MTSRFRTTNQDPEVVRSQSASSASEERSDKLLQKHSASINTNIPLDMDDAQESYLLPKVQFSRDQPQRRQLFRRRLPGEEDGQEKEDKKKRSFCRTWCDMWFLLSQSKISCILLNAVLFGGGLLVILLTTFGGLMNCPELNGAVVFLFLVSSLSIALGCLCCCYHWVKDNDDLPYGIFCVAYCLLFLFICVTISGTVIVFTRIHPVGTDQPPPDMVNGTIVNNLSKCTMTELPLGLLIICYCLSIVFLLVAYCACVLAYGARHVDD